MKLRVKFAKSGAMRFIGHLDVMRYFQKAIRRAGIDIAYSEGFSPHQIMSFAAPLGVGLESRGEYFDMEVRSYTTLEDVKARLNRVMVEGMEILNVTALGEGAKNAMASVAAAAYTVRFREGYEPDFDWAGAMEAFYAQPSIPVTKKTKKSEVLFDLKPAIYSLEVEREEDGIPVVHMQVDASSSGNIKPGLVMEAFLRGQGRELPDFALSVTREETFTNIGTAAEPVLAPLDAAGIRPGQEGGRAGELIPSDAAGIRKGQEGGSAGEWNPPDAARIRTEQEGGRTGELSPLDTVGIRPGQEGGRTGEWNPPDAVGIRTGQEGGRAGELNSPDAAGTSEDA